MHRIKASVVIPCLNEERTIGCCVVDALAGLERAGVTGEVVVCDNGSADRSAERAARAGGRVVFCAAKGYGNAVRHGVESSLGELIVMGDGDGSYDLSNISPLVLALLDGVDLVMGNRFRGGIQPGAMPWKNQYVGTPALSVLVKLLFSVPFGDVNCGLRGFTREAFNKLELRASGMEFASEMIARAAQAKLRIAEVPTVLRPDGRGRAPHLRPWRDGWRHVQLLIMLWAKTAASHSEAGQASFSIDAPPRS